MQISQILELVIVIVSFLTVVVPIAVQFLALLIKTKGKFLPLLTALFAAVCEAERKFPDGQTKLAHVLAEMTAWGAENGVKISPAKLTRLINMTVAVANLVMGFVEKRIPPKNDKD